MFREFSKHQKVYKTELKPFHSIGIVKSNASLQDSLKLRAAPRHSGGEAGGGLLRL